MRSLRLVDDDGDVLTSLNEDEVFIMLSELGGWIGSTKFSYESEQSGYLFNAMNRWLNA